MTKFELIVLLDSFDKLLDLKAYDSLQEVVKNALKEAKRKEPEDKDD